jgi:hypothetical protein
MADATVTLTDLESFSGASFPNSREVGTDRLRFEPEISPEHQQSAISKLGTPSLSPTGLQLVEQRMNSGGDITTSGK